MFDWSWIDDLDATAASDELARAKDLLIAAEAGQFVLAAHWADLHASEFVEGCRRALPGMPRLVAIGPDGCPEIEEFAGAELAALLGRSTGSGQQLIADAVTVRHRHPMLWQGIRAGEVRVWLAVRVARRCAAAELSPAQAEWVDAQTTPYQASLTPRRFLDLVEAKIVEADPAAAEERARAASLERFVRAGMRDEHGLRTLVARAHAGDVTYLVAVLDRIAVILAEQGDPDPVEVRRTTALRILANPARALALLTGAALAEAVAGPATRGWPHQVVGADAEEEPDGGQLSLLGVAGPGDASHLVDVTGQALPATASYRDLAEAGEFGHVDLGLAVDGASSIGPGPEEHADPALLRPLADALAGFDAARLDPVTVLHVHLTDAILAAGRGVVRCEELGPMTLGAVRDWLTHPTSPEEIRSRVRIRPVLDAEAVVPVDRYEVAAAMSDLGAARTPFEVFPYGTLAGRKAEDDHVIPWPGGRTEVDNLAKLSRRHHRIKTHGGWTLHHPSPGVYWWRTRHGHWFRVDEHGTHHHGRDPALDERWSSAEQRAA